MFLLWFVFVGFTSDVSFVVVSYFTGGFTGDMCLVIGGLFLLLMVVQLTYCGCLFARFAGDGHFIFVACCHSWFYR